MAVAEHMNPDGTTEIPLAPEDLWKRRRETSSLLAARWIALVAIVAAPFVQLWIVTILAVLALVVQILTNLGRRTLYLRNIYGLPGLVAPLDATPASALPGVTLIAPARNEEAGIEAAARSVAQLAYPALDAIFVNDHSTDTTGAILDRVSAEFPHLRVIHDPPFHEGWLGKANSVWHGVQQSDPGKPWLALADADVVFHPEALRAAVELAEARQYDFLTCVVYLDNGSFAEELYMPQAWAALIQGAHFDKLDDARTACIGVGAFILVKREVYLKCGGHAAIRNRQPEDTLLAALVKKAGGKMGVCWTTELMRVRIYRGYAQLRQFVSRKMRMQIEGRPSRLLHRTCFVLLQDVVPFTMGVVGVVVQVARGEFSVQMSIFSVACFAAYLSCVASFEKFRVIARMRPGMEWLHPLTGLLRISFFANAGWQILLGKRMEWRGRDFTG